MSEKPNPATMTAAELEAHINEEDAKHKAIMKELKTLCRLRAAEEAAQK